MDTSTSPSRQPESPVAVATQVLTRAVADGELASVPDAELQALLAAAVRLYAARVEQHGRCHAFPADTVSATDVAVTATAMLEAVDVGVFELSMWQTIKGAPTS